MASVVLRGGRVLDPSQKLDMVADVLILDGKVEEVGPGLAGLDASTKVVDCKGKLVTPGWVDMHVHLRTPGGNHKENITTGTTAAAAGGFTTVVCMANTTPVNDNPFITSFLQERIRNEAKVNVYMIGACTKGLEGQQLAEIGGMFEAGIVALSDDGKTVQNSYIMRKAMDYSKRFNLTVITHAEDCYLKGKGVMNEGFHSAKYGLRGIPRESEDIIVARDIALCALTGARLHVAHVSTVGAVNLIRDAKRRGLQVTGEATPHHLTLTDEAVGNYDTNTKVAPPLREEQDVEALREAVADGTIDVLASDHAPHSVLEKEVEYDHAEFGMVGLETAFPLYHALHTDHGVTLERIIEAMTIKPATILGLNKGSLRRGSDGDVTVADLEAGFIVDKGKFKSKSRNTPFNGREVRGRALYTIVGGNVVYGPEETA